MRSYYSHLQAVQSVGEAVDKNRRPVFRSSAMFPVMHNEYGSSKVIFMGYWLLKRHIKEIGLTYTLRSEQGDIISRKYVCIDSTKAYSIELNEFADEIGDDFTGSLELEIFSTRDLVFPYPAFVLVYYSDSFSTAVHTVGRVYNDIEDLSSNEEYRVRESGFDIYGNPDLVPFVGFTNGPISNKQPELTYEVVNATGEAFHGSFTLSALRPFETHFLRLKDHLPLDKWLGERAGTIRLGHNFEGFFPRFTVGNFDERTRSISITHSYYDSSPLTDSSAYWNRIDETFHDSSVAIPLYITNGLFTRLVLYPTFSPSDFTLSFRFFDAEGELLAHLPDHTTVVSNQHRYDQIDLGTLVAGTELALKTPVTVTIDANWTDKSRIPTRLKFGLNVGYTDRLAQLPSNVCFAPALGNPKVLTKPGTFRWAPFVSVGRSEIAFTNAAPLKTHDRLATVNLSFHREQDDRTLYRTIAIPANGIRILDRTADEELNSFFGDGSGWVGAAADNPIVNGFYFDFHENGSVAADHLF